MILEQGQIGQCQIKNRCVVPPMLTNLADARGFVTEDMIAYYRTRAEGGYGLIIIEITAVDPRGRATAKEVGLWDDDFIPGFTKLIAAVHEAGAKVFVQLHHAGRETLPNCIGGQTPEAPSAVACPLMRTVPEAMSEARILEVIDAFGNAALRAKKAGADGVEIHGAHGYLIAQFMSGHANKRFDAWGGDFFGRMKFPMAVFQNVREKVGKNYPISFRFSCDEHVVDGRRPEESVMIARLAEQCGIDVLNISEASYGSFEYMIAPPAMPAGFNQFQTKMIKDAVQIPVIAVGRFNAIMGEGALLSGCADFIAFGRESLADPAIPNKIAENRMSDIIPCIGCTQACIEYVMDGRSVSCLVNPQTGKEARFCLEKTDAPKKIMVIGGGPAGLEAALITAAKGHKVTLYEKENECGGLFRLAAVPPTKYEITGAIKYWVQACQKAGVTFRMNTEVTEDLVLQEKPDIVLVATGGHAAKPPIPGIDHENIISAYDVLSGQILPQGKILVIGGGMTGVETAEFMAERGCEVTILEMRPEIAMDEASIPKKCLLPRIKQHGIETICNAKVLAFAPDGVNYDIRGAQKTLYGYDKIVLAMGVVPENALWKKLKTSEIETYVIGDALHPGPAHYATGAAFRIAAKL